MGLSLNLKPMSYQVMQVGYFLNLTGRALIFGAKNTTSVCLSKSALGELEMAAAWLVVVRYCLHF